MRFNQRQVEIGFLIGGIIMGAIYLFLFQRPLNIKIKGLLSERRDLIESRIPVESIKQRLDELEQKKLVLAQEIRSLENIFHRSNLLDVMQRVGIIAEQLGLTITLIHPKLEPKGGSLFIKLEGDFPGFYNFIYLLEENTPLLQAESLKIEAGLEENMGLVGEMQFNLFYP